MDHHDPDIRELGDLVGSGLLWLINTALLHPRGYAMTLHYEAQGYCIGWSIQGDGGEPWKFGDDTQPAFDAIKELLSKDYGTYPTNSGTVNMVVQP